MTSEEALKRRHLSWAIAGILIIGGAASLGAATYKGTVISVSGDVAKVAMEGDVMPPNGARAEIFFKIAGSDEEISVATGSALKIDMRDMLVKIEEATGTVEKGHLVRFTSKTTASTTTVDSAPPPITIADLAKDYRPGTASGVTSDSVGLRGTAAGTWHFFQDNDLSTTNGNAGELRWKSNAQYFNSKRGYAGTDTDFGMIFPIVSSERLLDGPAPAPPAGSLMGHPSGRRYLAIQFRLAKNETVVNPTIQYRFEKPNLFHQAEVHITKNSGGADQVLFSKKDLGAGAANQTAEGTLSGIGTLKPGDSVWIMLGAAGDAAGDQAWLQLTLVGSLNTSMPAPPAGFPRLSGSIISPKGVTVSRAKRD